MNFSHGSKSVLFAAGSILAAVHSFGTAYAAPKAPQPQPENIEKAPLFLGQGEQRVLRVPGLKRYSLGSPCIRVHSLGNELLVKGVSPGLSDLWVWKADGSSDHRTIQVERDIGTTLNPGLARQLGALQETEVLISGSGVILHGQIHTNSEAARVAALIRGYPGDVHDETEIAPALLSQEQVHLQDWISATQNGARLRVEASEGELWVRGSIDRPTERAAVERKLRGIFPLVKAELDSMPDTAPTVHFRVFLLEVKKTRFSTLGLEWPDAQQGAFQVSASAIQNLVSLNLTLHELEGDGSVKVLSNPELVVRAPGEAELFAGGELPIRLESRFYSDIAWKTYGLTLKLKVTATTADQVRLDIFTEVSRLDPSLAQNDIPGVQSNRMQTEVDARYGVPLLLSGLLQQGTRKAAKGLPLLRSIPILGALFGSEDYLNERSELIAILVPSSSPPPAPLARIQRLAPKGMLPPPRDWVSAEDEEKLTSSSDYPWNAFK